MKKITTKFIAVLILIFGVFFAQAALITPTHSPLIEPAYADENEENPGETPTEEGETPAENEETPTEIGEDEPAENGEETPSEEEKPVCTKQTGAVSWIVCSVMNAAGNFVDNFYSLIERFLVVEPISTDTSSATYQVWRALLRITNIIFVIFMIVVIYSQLTGIGLNNYGIKRVLPRLIIAVILVNLSYLVCSIAVDVSNVIGGSLDGILQGIQESALANVDVASSLNVSWGDFTRYLTGGVIVGGIAVIGFAGIEAVFWGVVIALIGAIISLGIGFITIALRQGLIIVLVMIAPLAFVAYLLPNTEKWFQKWKAMFFQMLVFYPMFSLLFGASKLAGWAIIAAADRDPIKVLIGLAVQVMPLFFSFSLFKMSGTVLGNVSAGLHRLASPLNTSLGGWAQSHQEQARSLYLGNQYTPGGKLRGYLDYRRALRESDTAKATALRNDRALERANHRSASYLGLDTHGNPRFGTRFGNYANLHTVLQKRASLAATRAAASQQMLTNNLSDYSNTFSQSEAAKRISAAHGRAFEDTMMEQFRAVNIAQGDQSLLLNSYLDAAKNRARSPYEFNRLIRSATGGIGHYGEATIIGQVLDRSVQMENQRRREAIVAANKFGYVKSEFRGMILDKENVNDDGYEETAEGEVIENKDFRYKKGKAHLHRGWGKYIAVHKDTKREIEKEEYEALSKKEQAQYRKVKYMEIRDDNDDVIQRVFDDDAGYMKEMLAQDIAIGDPINVRYLTEIGLRHHERELTDTNRQYAAEEKDGLLRRYHSTITSSMLASRYSEHNAAVTAMLTAQANSGYLTTPGQFHIASLDSLWKAAKTGKILQNDAPIIESWTRLFRSLDTNAPEGERFEDIITDADIALFRNVNGRCLKGLRLATDEQGNDIWQEINRTDPSLTVDDQRNYLRHKTIPAVIKKLIGSIDRKPSPNILDSQKPDATLAFCDLAEAAVNVAQHDLEQLPPEERNKAENDLLSAKSPDTIPRYLNNLRDIAYQQLGMDYMVQERRKQRRGRNNDGVPLGNHQDTYFDTGKRKGNNGNNGSGNGQSQSGQSQPDNGQSQPDDSSDLPPVPIIDTFNERLERSDEYDDYYDYVNDGQEIRATINDIFRENYDTDIIHLGATLIDYINDRDSISSSDKDLARSMIEEAMYAYQPDSTEDAIEQSTTFGGRPIDTASTIDQVTNRDSLDDSKQQLEDDLINFIDNIFNL